MKLLAVAVCLLALSGAPANAGWHQLQTRFGPLEVIRDTVDESIHFSGRPVSGPDGESLRFRYGFVGVWQIADEDVALVRGWGGGNDPCSNDYLIVAVSAAGARAIVPFGRCTVEVMAVRVLADRLEIELRAADPRLDHVMIVYAEGRVDELKAALPDDAAPPPGGGTAVTRWEGEHAHSIVRDAGERQRFVAIMPREKLFELMDRMHVGGAAVLKDGWLIATGCMPHRCNLEAGAFAIEIATGRPEAVIFHDGRAPEVFGGDLRTLYPRLRAFARTGMGKN